MDEWCGGFGPNPWLPRGAGLSPCWQETSSWVALIVLALPVLALQARRTAAAAAAAQPRNCPCKRGLTGGETSYLILALFVAAIHLTHLITALVVLRDLPFHIAYHTALLLLWIAVAVAQRQAAATRHVILHLLPLIVLAEAAYLWDVYTMFAAYFGTDAFPRAYIKSRCVKGG